MYCCVSLSEEVPVRGLDAKSSDNGAEFWTLHTSGYTSGHYATLHNVYFVKYDVTVSFMAQVLDTVTYFVSQVLDTAS